MIYSGCGYYLEKNGGWGEFFRLNRVMWRFFLDFWLVIVLEFFMLFINIFIGELGLFLGVYGVFMLKNVYFGDRRIYIYKLV